MLITPFNLDSPFQYCVSIVVHYKVATLLQPVEGEEGCHSGVNEDNGDSFI